ncbi:Fumarylacetoacetate hydrolase domain-containing protein [Heterostelium album PN500]|uniref:Fumarylacetoacetate hydrolase domain-containing protein n=1 Tax=Heterostelium pallidum (strain ATCC 26659 / Pp 5 / PN500) TaxID=670386 RepID=D3B8B3_HETP5|nr:Fumarylacetoacetate hydrolase domain-containing protein [Heterostelium album PN500]EFA82281.1 Fumarylacetoacetate hydrolase domain-containing protein [Heterostelium album PN500]|eukprot:XP_020434398.1 Fumarylacetoacetate hydrolase domain-containing protein [Heterostelium album PN500]
MNRFWEKGSKIVAVARNYAAHAKELGNEVPAEPFFFLKPMSSLVRVGSPIEIPRQTTDVHHEVELGVIIGKRGRDIKVANAMDHVVGYTLALDLTARDLQSKAKTLQQCWTIAKGFDTFCPVSDFIPKEKIANPSNIELWLTVDGVTKQKDTTDKMIVGIPELIEFVSQIMTLEEGDIILTGTPSGVGPIKPGQKVKAGISDIIEMEFDVINRKYN